MVVRLVGSKEEDKKIINDVIENFNYHIDIQEISALDKDKYNIKHTPAIIIENIVIDDLNGLSKNELNDIFYQFLEVY